MKCYNEISLNSNFSNYTKISNSLNENLRDLKNGSVKAFNLLYDAYYHKIYNYSFRISNSQFISEETTQEVFIKLWEIKSRLNLNRSFEGFIRTIAKNYILNVNKKNSYQQKFVSENKIEIEENNLLEKLIQKELLEIIEKRIFLLPPKQKIIYNLFYKKNLKSIEIAQNLNISIRTVENQIFRATKRLKNI